MITVEDVLEGLFRLFCFNQSEFETCLPDKWFSNFVTNVHSHAAQGKTLSTEQVRITVRLAHRARNVLITNDIFQEPAFDRFLGNPICRKQPYQSSSVPREARYVGDNCIALRFKMNDVIVESIKALRKKNGFFSDNVIRWDREARVWVIRVTRDTIDPLMSIIGENRFDVDDETVEYLALAMNSREKPSTFVLDPETGRIVANVCDNEVIAAWVTNVLWAEIL